MNVAFDRIPRRLVNLEQAEKFDWDHFDTLLKETLAFAQEPAGDLGPEEWEQFQQECDKRYGELIHGEHAPEQSYDTVHHLWNNPELLRSYAQIARKVNATNDWSDSEIQSLLFHLIEQAKTAAHEYAGEMSFSDVIQIERCFMPETRSSDERDAIDAYCAAMPEIWKRFPRDAHQITDLFDQNAQVAKPAVYFSSMARIFSDPDVPVAAQEGAAAGLAYQTSFNLLPFLRDRVKELSSLSSEEALSMLTLIEATMRYGHGWSFSENSARELRKVLQDFSHSDVPVLLRRKAEALLQRHHTDLLNSEKSTAAIHDPAFARATIIPAARDFLGVYYRNGTCIGLLPRQPSKTSYALDELIPIERSHFLQQDATLSTEEERRHHEQETSYRLLLDANVLSNISKDFGFLVEELSMREQVWFAASLRTYHKAEEERVQLFTKRFGADGARAFLSTEFGDDFRAVVLAIGDNLSQDLAIRVFHTFSEIITLAQATAEEIGKQFFAEHQLFDVNAVQKDLLRRAQTVLTSVENFGVDESGLMIALDQARADLVLFATMFKNTQKGKCDVKFEDLKGVRLETVKATELSEADKEKIIAIAQVNWFRQKPEVANKILDGMRGAMSKAGTDFVVLRKDKDIGAFMRFDHRDDGTVYAGSLNVNPALRSAGLGESMMKAAIDAVAKDRVIVADVFPELPIAMKYVSDFGCVITGVEDISLGDGKEVQRLTIRRDDEQNRHYEGKLPGVPHRSSQVQIEKFDLSLGTTAMIETVKRATAAHKIGSQYFVDQTNPNIRYITFEPEITLDQMAIAAK